MLGAFSLSIGLRYTAAPRSNRFVSLVSIVALFAMCLGVAALIVVMSVMNGFERELRDRILAVVPHGMVIGPAADEEGWQRLNAELDANSDLRGRAPYLGGPVMLNVGERVQGVSLQGVLPAEEDRASALGRYVVEGDIRLLQPGEFAIVLGALVARQLGVSSGDRVTVVLPQLSVTPAGVLPRVRQFRVVGLFSVGAQVDADTAFIHLEDATRLFRAGQQRGLRLWFHDPELAPRYMAALGESLGPAFALSDWSKSQGSLFGAIQLEKRMVGILLLVMVAVAAFNIVSIMTMTVAEKRSAIAVLRTLGASRLQVMGIFLTRGLALGLLGIVAGLALGIPLATHAGVVTAWLESTLGFRLFNPNVYFISYLPSLLRWADVVTVAVLSLLLTLLATLYPSWRATHVGPAELLAYD